MKILGISGTIVGSKTAALVKKVLDEVQELNPDIEVELLDLSNYDIQFCDGRDPSLYTGDTKLIIDKVTLADFYVIGTPIFNVSMTGTLKNLLDLVPPSAFRGKVMGFVANGSTYQHYLVIDNQIKPIAGYFRAFVAPSSVYVLKEQFNEINEIIDTDIIDRIKTLASELVTLQEMKQGQNNKCEIN
ncbi:NADPH-dependent FMN reductase [Bacillus sp. Marseille-P3661]|uniref:NADPH-dependent FMN reductase n=1 Tax=Bacillus sp. Marseille-P3661 TaxID=1936234 RepID=UPI000C816647|nr:NAD(P)H-dependent oxidoreductase [Bacillus sp. Marseille-P3661]